MNHPPKRRRVVGPFFAISLLLSAGVIGWQWQQRQQGQKTGPPVVEHQVSGSSAAAVPPDFVEAHAAELKLTGAQQQRLRPLWQAYRAEVQPLREQLRAASKPLEEAQTRSGGRRPVPQTELSAGTAELSRLGERLLALRRQYGESVAAILTKTQRQQAGELWRQSLTHPREVK